MKKKKYVDIISGILLIALGSIYFYSATTLPEALTTEPLGPAGFPQFLAVVLIALLSAVSCAGRVLFAGLPSVQPSSSLIILTGIVFGPQAGFMTGAMTALTSNMLLGQGPWTVWQMSAWGMMGLSSGLLQRLLKRHGLLLSLYGCVWGFLFGWFMNLWTVSGGFFGPFSLRAVVAACAASLPLDLAHAACNLLLLLLFAKPFLRKMERIAVKYGLKQQI